jgi:hypothetical protein
VLGQRMVWINSLSSLYPVEYSTGYGFSAR